MPFVAKNAASYVGQTVDDGHCVAYVRACADMPHTRDWRRGNPVRANIGDSQLAPGTAIATFDAGGHYANRTDGTSHAAIYISQAEHGLHVYDQWVGQPVHRRVIKFRGNRGDAINNGDCYHVIEEEKTHDA